jgi:hypothetical protein
MYSMEEMEAVCQTHTTSELCQKAQAMIRQLLASEERLRVALKDTADALEKFVDTEKVIREPYKTPLSAYDRAREALK